MDAAVAGPRWEARDPPLPDGRRASVRSPPAEHDVALRPCRRPRDRGGGGARRSGHLPTHGWKPTGHDERRKIVVTLVSRIGCAPATAQVAAYQGIRRVGAQGSFQAPAGLFQRVVIRRRTAEFGGRSVGRRLAVLSAASRGVVGVRHQALWRLIRCSAYQLAIHSHMRFSIMCLISSGLERGKLYTFSPKCNSAANSQRINWLPITIHMMRFSMNVFNVFRIVMRKILLYMFPENATLLLIPSQIMHHCSCMAPLVTGHSLL